jgi:hypothetical protein
MRYFLKRHANTQLYYWIENEHDQLRDYEFISFQGYIEGYEVDPETGLFAILSPNALIHYRQEGAIHIKSISTKEVHYVEVLGDTEAIGGPDLILNSLNPNPIEVAVILNTAETNQQKAIEYQNWLNKAAEAKQKQRKA